jgi:hypothetical protein
VIVGIYCEKKREDVFQSGIMIMALGVIVTLMVVIVILNARWIASLSSDAIVIRESVKYIYISMMKEPLWHGNYSGRGLIGAGYPVLIRVALSVVADQNSFAYIFVVLLGFGAAFRRIFHNSFRPLLCSRDILAENGYKSRTYPFNERQVSSVERWLPCLACASGGTGWSLMR